LWNQPRKGARRSQPKRGCLDGAPRAERINAMTAIAQPPVEQVEQERDAFIDTLLEATSGVWKIFTIYLGKELGYYEALADGEGHTSSDLAKATNTNERYAREWLEQQTVADILTVDNPDAEASERRFRLPAGHIEPLTETESLNYLGTLPAIVAGTVRPIDQVIDAFRDGSGVGFHDFGQPMRCGQAGMNRNLFLYELGESWLPSIPDVHSRLQNGNPARIADVGCGLGWSSIGMALAYPNVQVDSFDLDEASVVEAQELVREYGLEDRVNIQLRDAADPTLEGGYDLVTAFECVHDMSDPVGAISTMRRLAGDKGSVLIMDERTSEQFDPEGNDIEWLLYGFSVLHCLPVGMVDAPSAATGTVMRPSTLRGYARSAGFTDIEILPIDAGFFYLYRLIG
jgi:2-polyprenyl-3-methyl-5-hydroxy-6-metoxy-1,4-benzoquinol methylase